VADEVTEEWLAQVDADATTVRDGWARDVVPKLTAEIRRLWAEVDMVADRAARAIVQMGAAQRSELVEFRPVGWASLVAEDDGSFTMGSLLTAEDKERLSGAPWRKFHEVFVRDVPELGDEAAQAQHYADTVARNRTPAEVAAARAAARRMFGQPLLEPAAEPPTEPGPELEREA